jgi:carbon-monoxide dehydrogenase medium subunit
MNGSAAAPSYVRPTLLDDALAAMARPGAVVIAGGQTLIPRLTTGTARPMWLVDLSAIPELRIIDGSAGVIIGAMVSLTDLLESATLAKLAPLLWLCAAKTATPTVRNRATLVGNLVVADPASQLPTAMIALGAQLLLQRVGGRRWMDAEDFFIGPNQTITAADEIVTHIRLPTLPIRSGSGVSDISPRRNSRPLATASAVVAIDAQNRVEHVRLSVSGCGDIPRRCRPVEDGLLGVDLCHAPDKAHVLLTEHALPPGRGVLDAEYATLVLPVLMRRAVRAACAVAEAKRVTP